MRLGLDSESMLDAAHSSGEQFDRGVSGARELLKGRVDPERLCDITILGMGGSGISGDVFKAVTSTSRVPIVVHKGYGAPSYLGKKSLVVAVSFSGNTEETVSGLEEAIGAGAQVITVASGGRCRTLVEAAGGIAIDIDARVSQPRSALCSLVAPLVVLGEELSVLDDPDVAIGAASSQLHTRVKELRADFSQVLEWVKAIDRSWPLFYGGDAIGLAAAQRFKGQMNENAKIPAFYNYYPELNHNEVVGWGQHGDVSRQVLTLVELRHAYEHPQTTKRFELSRPLAAEAVREIIEIVGMGESRLAQLLDLMLLGDYLSIATAFALNVDPGPVPVLGDLKAALAR